MTASNDSLDKEVSNERSWDAWSSRLHPLLVGALSFLLAALFMEKLLSDWALFRHPSSISYPEDPVMLGVLFLGYLAFFVMYFVRPGLPLTFADRVWGSFAGKKGLKYVAERVVWIAAGLLLTWVAGKSLSQAAIDAMKEFKLHVLIIIGVGLLAGIVYVLFCRHPRSELGVRAWINRAWLAVIAAVSVWFLDWNTIAPYVPADVKSKFIYDLSKDLLAVAVAVAFIVAALYELGRHMLRLKLDRPKREKVHSVAIASAILTSIFVSTVCIYAVVLFFDFQWVNAIELRLNEVVSHTSWSESQLQVVRYHIILRDVFLVVPLFSLSMGWAGVSIYHAWQQGPGSEILETETKAEQDI